MESPDALDWRGKLSRILLKEVSITCMDTIVRIEASESPNLNDTVWTGTSEADLRCIKVWDLSHNQLTDVGLMRIINATSRVTSDTLEKINLSYNYISDKYLVELCWWLGQFPNAQVDLRYNSLKEEDIRTPGLKKRLYIHGKVEHQMSDLEARLEERMKNSIEKIQRSTPENLARLFEEGIIPRIDSYLAEKGWPHTMVVNRDPEYRNSRELHAPGKPHDIVREYDGLFVIDVGTDFILLNNASQLHLTAEKLSKIELALLSLTTAMIPSWMRNPNVKLRRRCPEALTRWMTDAKLPRLRLMVTYFTVEGGLDLVARADAMRENGIDIQFVQFNILDTQRAIPYLKSAIDELVQPFISEEEEEA